MTTLRYLAAAAVSVGLLVAPANATTFLFKSGAGPFDTPTGDLNVSSDCGTTPDDICSDDDSLGLTYDKDGISVNVTAYTNGDPTTLIQDITPANSGLGALSEGNNIDDQTQASAGESVKFVFNTLVALTNIEFNAGDDNDCDGPLAEGPCGTFDLIIDEGLATEMTLVGLVAINLMTDVFIGTTFEFVATQIGAGFVIAQFEVNEVPVPAALPLLLSGLAGLGFAARRRKTA